MLPLLFLLVAALAFGQGQESSPVISIERSNGGSEVTVTLNILEGGPESKRHAGEETINVCLGKENLRIKCSHHLSMAELLPIGHEDGHQLYFDRNGELLLADGSSITINETNDRNLTTRNFYCYAKSNDGQGKMFYSKAVKVVYFDCSTPIDSQVTKVNVTLGGSANLNCWTNDLGNHLIPKFEWAFRGVWTTRARVESTDKAFVIPKISQSDIGSFICYAWLESIQYRFAQRFALVLSTPLTPVQVEIEWIERCIRMKWKEDGCNSLATVHRSISPSYKITLKTGYTPEKSTVITTDETNLDICNVSPNTDYRLELKAINQFGESRPIAYKFRTTNGSKVTPTVSYDTQVTISLDEKVVVPCRAITRGNDTTDESTAPRFHLAFDPIKPEHSGFYECKNEYNDHPSYVMRLSILIPPGPVRELNCTPMANQQIKISWIEPHDASQGDSLVKDAVESYRVQHRIFYFGNYQSWSEETVRNSSSVVLKSGSNRGRLQLIRVTATNEAGHSPPKSILCRVQ